MARQSPRKGAPEGAASEDQQTVTLRYADVAVTLKFTDQPDDPPKKDVKKEPAKGPAKK